MTATRDPDQIISIWLDEMPDRVADRVIGSVLQAVATTPQVRRRFVGGSRRYQLMNRFVLIGATIALGVVLIGGAAFLTGGQNKVAGPSVTPTSSPTLTPALSPSAASCPCGPVPAELQARWMGSTRSFTAGAGISLLLDSSTYSISLPNSSEPLGGRGTAGSVGPSELLLGGSSAYTCPGTDKGQYAWQLSPSGRTLTLTPTSDACAQRAADVAGVYWLMRCTDPEWSCLGDLDAGTYATQWFRPAHVDYLSLLFGGVIYTVPDGWANYEDWGNKIGLTTSADFANTTSSDPEPASAVDVLTDATALAAPCSLYPSASQSSLHDALTSLGGNIDVTAPTPITVSGFSGDYVDVTAVAVPAPSGAGSSATLCGSDIPYFYAAGGAQAISVGQKQRLVLLDQPGGHLLALVISANASKFDAFVTAAMPIIQSMSFN